MICTSLVFFFLTTYSFSAPIQNAVAREIKPNSERPRGILFLEDDEPRASPDESGALFGFLKQFGYLPTGAPNTEALHAEEAITEAVKRMQLFGGLEPSGIPDKETIKLLSKSRCGNKDEDEPNGRTRFKRFIVGSKGWKKRRLSYHLANWTPKLQSKEFVVKALDQAFQSWSRYAKLDFVKTEDYNDADIRVIFGRYNHGDSYPFDGPGRVLAHAYYPYEFGDFGGDIHFDEDEGWSQNVTDLWSGTDFFSVAQHEIGHSLGLSHSPVSESVMFPYYRGKQGNQGIGYDDVLAMYELYIKDYADDEENTEPSTTQRMLSTTKTTTTTTATPTTRETSTSHYPDYVNDEAGDSKEEDICFLESFDSIAYLRSEIFVFRGTNMWRFSDRGAIRPGYPAPAYQMFGFPETIELIDAAYERPGGDLVFFTGNSYWVSNGNYFIDGSPRPLTDLGLPTSIDKIDAVFVWGKNQKTYIFHNDLYWRFDELTRRVEDSYPKHIGIWQGVPRNITGVLTWKNGATFFFQSFKFWEFDDQKVTVKEQKPRDTARDWFGC